MRTLHPELPPIPSRADAVGEHLAGGGQVAAVLPVHYPRSLLRAFDLLPVEVWGPPVRDTQLGDAHLQAYTCSVVRSGLAVALAGGIDVASVLVVPHTCDSLQGLASLLLDLVPARQAVVPLYHPRVGGPAGTYFLAAELRAVYTRLADVTGRHPDDAALSAAIAREEAADARLAALLARQGSLPLGDRAFYTLARSREYLPAERFTPLADAALALPDAPADPAQVPIVLSGMFPEPMALFDAIAAAGGRVVGDDTACVGRRAYPAGRSDDPFVRMAERLVDGPPDSTRGSAVAVRLARLRGLVAARGVRAVLFLEVKFCEPELFYLPLLRAGLEADGVRSTTIEVDVTEALPHQAITRLEALLETVAP
ncbi:MAG: hypothetical protein CVU56_21900 [Deltaproteobacteria bacterium HGW-Deltaproteobacteria-14]|jgi:benzoyl-CoA reductase/2-hydroxyglutaryl-CoA dehydratase subunit BcrC/BadD/HgdB|nr:MAG: hypothetical protein CVU56_21900 [Deltaproteobacteria bacterium HGW-Deltaproteobacteria-14]